MFWPEPGSFQQCTHWVHARQQPRPQLQTNLGRGEGGGQMGPLFTLAFSTSSSRMASLTCNSDYRFLLWNGVHHKSLSTPECHMFLQVVPSESEKENYSIWETNLACHTTYTKRVLMWRVVISPWWHRCPWRGYQTWWSAPLLYCDTPPPPLPGRPALLTPAESNEQSLASPT